MPLTRVTVTGWMMIGLALAALTACAPAPSETPVYTVVSEGELTPGEAIPAPDDEVILTVTGLIGAANIGDGIEMDLATIESVGLVDYTVTDPFEGDVVTFRGVLMSTLLDLWQVSDEATTLHMVALNDYAVDVPMDSLREYPVIFAVMEDGEYMPVSTRGPAMLVYPYDDFQFDVSVYNDYWIWQIKSIDVQ